MKILITGAAGFIGFHLAKRLCQEGHEIIGIDNLNDYYDVSLKEARLEQLKPYKNFKFIKIDISDRAAMENLFSGRHCEPTDLSLRGESRSNPDGTDLLFEHSREPYIFDRVIHLAAQAGVRYSLENPHAYIQSNVVGFTNILEGCRYQWAKGEGQRAKGNASLACHSRESGNPKGFSNFHLVYASSSSVYGSNTKLPFSVQDNVDHPISLYAATKKANELMAHTYSHLYGIPTTGLRFFTVYGPWGRPDMALFKFTKAILKGEPIDVYNNGQMSRDFTYIDDIVEGVVRVTNNIPSPLVGEGQGEGRVPYRLYNIGNHNPVKLMDFIVALEEALGKKAKLNFLPMQPGDVRDTYANVDDLIKDVNFSPSTSIEEGLSNFIKWYLIYRNKEQ